VSEPAGAPLGRGVIVMALLRHGVGFLAVGGITAMWPGARRPTKDFDLCPAWSTENLERVANPPSDHERCPS